MLRRVFTLLSALSLLLCVASAALWVRSYWIGDSYQELRVVRPGGPMVVEITEIEVGRGNIAFGVNAGAEADGTPSQRRLRLQLLQIEWEGRRRRRGRRTRTGGRARRGGRRRRQPARGTGGTRTRSAGTGGGTRTRSSPRRRSRGDPS